MFNSIDIMLIVILVATILFGVALHWFFAAEDRP